jgi:hypothetical protein
MTDLRNGDLMIIVLVLVLKASPAFLPLGRSLHKGEIKRGSPDRLQKAENEDDDEASFS